LRFAEKSPIDAAPWPASAAGPAFTNHAGVHATVVRKLFDIGAVLYGKTGAPGSNFSQPVRPRTHALQQPDFLYFLHQEPSP
jgi:Asp-tRNA(Asn)/Glu-tRNA(Gln) amidotransferase A subunit family amidase